MSEKGCSAIRVSGNTHFVSAAQRWLLDFWVEMFCHWRTWLSGVIPLLSSHISLSFLPSHMHIFILYCFQQFHTMAIKSVLLAAVYCSYKSWLSFGLQFILIIWMNTQALVKFLSHRKSNKVTSLWVPWFGYKDNIKGSCVEGLGHHVTVIWRGGWTVTILTSAIN